MQKTNKLDSLIQLVSTSLFKVKNNHISLRSEKFIDRFRSRDDRTTVGKSTRGKFLAGSFLKYFFCFAGHQQKAIICYNISLKEVTTYQ